MAVFETRADIVAHHAYYLTILPLTRGTGEQIESWVGAGRLMGSLWSGMNGSR